MGDRKNYGALYETDNQSDWSELQFLIQRTLMQVNTFLPAQVLSVSGGGVAPVGMVQVKIIVSQLAGNNETVDNPTIANVPYVRIQGGKNAVIIDPRPGDIGVACFCQRDISAVKRSRKAAPPGSHRTFSLSDAIYLNGILNGKPEQYIKFDESGIEVYSPTDITMIAPTVTINASKQATVDTPLLVITGQMTQTGAKGSGATTSGGITNTGGTISSNGIVLETHVHSGVQPGGGNTGQPV